MNKKYDSILDEAKQITGHDRMTDYGHPEENFQNIANLWNCYLYSKTKDLLNLKEHDASVLLELLKADDIAMLMVLFKVARQMNGPKRDNLTDIAGYARNSAQIQGLE